MRGNGAANDYHFFTRHSILISYIATKKMWCSFSRLYIVRGNSERHRYHAVRLTHCLYATQMFKHYREYCTGLKRTTAQKDGPTDPRPATWLHFAHEIAVLVSRSTSVTDEACRTVLAESRLAQWVTLHNIYIYPYIFFREMWFVDFFYAIKLCTYMDRSRVYCSSSRTLYPGQWSCNDNYSQLHCGITFSCSLESEASTCYLLRVADKSPVYKAVS